LQYPDYDCNDNHYVQDRLDTAGHGYKVIDQPQQNADDDQRDDDVYQGHIYYSPAASSSNPLTSRQLLG
jgi:hypothetical protein